jgi:hypothetical protein
LKVRVALFFLSFLLFIWRCVGDYNLTQELQELFAKPYERQSDDMHQKYYRKTAAVTYEGAGLG